MTAHTMCGPRHAGLWAQWWAQMGHGRPRGGFQFGGPGYGHGWGGPPWGGGPWGRGFGKGARVRRGDVRAAILALLAEEARNGYQIIQEIERRSDGVWRPSPGSIYPALQQLEDEGLIQATESEGRKAFELTDEGRAYVESHDEEVAAPWETVSQHVTDEVLEFGNLVRQVGSAMMQVMVAGSETQRTEALAVLNETKRSLYRILAEEAD